MFSTQKINHFNRKKMHKKIKFMNLSQIVTVGDRSVGTRFRDTFLWRQGGRHERRRSNFLVGVPPPPPGSVSAPALIVFPYDFFNIQFFFPGPSSDCRSVRFFTTYNFTIFYDVPFLGVSHQCACNFPRQASLISMGGRRRHRVHSSSGKSATSIVSEAEDQKRGLLGNGAEVGRSKEDIAMAIEWQRLCGDWGETHTMEIQIHNWQCITQCQNTTNIWTK